MAGGKESRPEIQEVRVYNVDEDPHGRDIKAEAVRRLGISSEELEKVETSHVYRLQGVSEEEAQFLAAALLTDPVTQKYTVNTRDHRSDAETVEVAYKSGVMNPTVGTFMKAASNLGISPEAVSASEQYSFFGSLSISKIEEAASKILVNKTVQEVITVSPTDLTFEGQAGLVSIVPIREATPADLDELSEDKLFLNSEEMDIIQSHFKKLDRDPTDAELEIIAARWSEHCGHKTFNAKMIVDGKEKLPLFTRIKTAAEANFGDLVVSAFSDNSGVIRMYDGMAICGKVETHNSPSAIEPYGGAMTGSGGVFRDILGTGQGAKILISTDAFCFAPPKLDPSRLPSGAHAPDYLHRRVVDGVRDYGNRMGIPTANGSVHYHEDFRAKPTIIVGAYGLMPERRAAQGEPKLGDRVVIIGGRTGRDGIHGATFSSGDMTERTESVNGSAVQIGNAVEEKRMADALLEARDADCIRAMTDCGAAGFSSAVGEMGEDVGVTVDISNVPLKYAGLAPWEIWLSESQERMVAAVEPSKLETFMEICKKYNVEATDIGVFDGSETLTVTYGGDTVAELDYDFLKYGLPQRVMTANWEQPMVPEIRPEVPATPDAWANRIKAVLSHGNVCSKEPIVRQYDHGVQGGNIVPPYGGATQSGPNDALVIRPMSGKPYGVVQSHGMNPILNRLDPYNGSIWATTEALANYVAVGGNPDEVALVGNYIAPSPDEETMGALDKMVDAAADMMHITGAPVISGKDSLSSTYRSKEEVIKIPPVYCVSAFGPIPDVEKTVTSALQSVGDIYFVGELSTAMGGSTYYDIAGGSSINIPKVAVQTLPSTLKAVHTAIISGAVQACHDVSEGGIVTAVAEMCFGNNQGAHLFVPTQHGAAPDDYLFSESAGSFVVQLQPSADPKEVFGDAAYHILGTAIHEPQLSGQDLFELPLVDLKAAWQQPMQELFHDD